ncbi:hypothetical protein C8Q75DRAFT_751951 [Abortiporus biennis]|nr:hypothetical protein C8Q75DRAFT_751951 [Abortiporus biennis]
MPIQFSQRLSKLFSANSYQESKASSIKISTPVLVYSGANPATMSGENLVEIEVASKRNSVVMRGFEVTIKNEGISSLQHLERALLAASRSSSNYPSSTFSTFSSRRTSFLSDDDIAKYSGVWDEDAFIMDYQDSESEDEEIGLISRSGHRYELHAKVMDLTDIPVQFGSDMHLVSLETARGCEDIRRRMEGFEMKQNGMM